MTTAKQGDTVKVYYTSKTDDGKVFASTDRRPVEFTIGETPIIPGFLEAILGMSPGDTKSVEIPADKAYGPHRDELVLEIGSEKLPPNVDPQIGQQLRIPQPDGGSAIVRVTERTDSSVTLDANHPMAGKDMVFDIELVEIMEEAA